MKYNWWQYVSESYTPNFRFYLLILIVIYFIYVSPVCYMWNTWTSQSKNKIEQKNRFINILQRNTQVLVNKTYKTYHSAK